MKKRIAIILVILMYIFMPVISNAENLVRNGNFSELNGQEITNWAKGENNPDYFTVSAKDNTLCMENNITNFSEISQSVKVLPNKYYKLSAKIKVTKSSNSGAYIMVRILDDAVKSKSEIVSAKNNDWEEVTIYGKTEDSQYAICVNLCFGEKDNKTQGKAYFKDITLEEVDYVPQNYEDWYVSDVNAGEKAILINLFAKLALVSFVMFLIWCMIKSIKNNTLGEVTHKKLDKKDAVIITVLTLAYLVLALYNLGDKVSPQTGWYPKEKGEYVIIKLPKMTHIEKITYYEGLDSQESGKGKIKLQYLDGEWAQDKEVERYHILNRKGFDSFKWKELNEDMTASLIKLEALEEGMDLREIAVYEKGSKKPLQGLKILEDKTREHVAKNLIDEQQYAQYEGSYKNQTIFDEICYPRTGYEYINNMKGFEATHPPLGKIFVALGIKIFGMTPFGWRIIGTLFGAAMIPVMYLFSRKLFKERIYAILAASLIMFDCMHFVQTRTCLIDSYSVLFIILMYYYMTDIYTSHEQKVTKKYIKSLALSGLFFSLGVATKWIAVYGGAGLCVMYFISLYKNLRQSKKEVVKSMGIATLAFVVLPILAYLAVYIPVLRPTDSGYTLMGVFNEVKGMFLFHKDEVFAHPYSSAWYEWFFMVTPMSFYAKIHNNGLISKIITVGNPLIWWISLASIAFSVIIGFRKKDNIIWIFVIGYIFQYLPWIFIKRTIFIYHYFSAIPFVIFAIIYMIKELYDNNRKEIYMYLAMVATTFIVFYPKLSGIPVVKSYDNLIKLMCILCVFWIAHYLNAVLKKIL